MKEKEFLESLVNEVNEGMLPFQEEDWQHLQQRLDAAKRKKIFPFLPPRLRYLSAGLAAALIVGIGLLYPSIKPSGSNDTTPLSQKQAAPIGNTAIRESASPEENPVPPSLSISAAKKEIRTAAKEASPPLPAYVPVDFPDTSGIAPAKLAPGTPTETPATAMVSEEKKQPVSFPDEETLPLWKEVHQTKNAPVFYAGGGVSYGGNAMGYAVKLGLEKPISSRFSLHTALALNTNDRNIAVSEIDRIIPKSVLTSNGNYTTYDTLYKQSHKDIAQAFAQALVGVDYNLYKNGKLGLSADAVRLLRSRQELDAFNETLLTDKESSLWNVGLRIQYTQQVSRHFDIGALYRQDVSSMLHKTWENNFLQLLLIYKIGGTKKD